MAIALDATSSSANQTGSSKTLSHTCTGNNRLLIVGVQITDATVSVSGITYAGVAMTKILDKSSPNNSRRVELWQLIAPASGTNNIIVTLSGSVTNWFSVGGVSYTGAAPANIVDASNSASANSGITDSTVSVTTLSDNVWLVGILCNGAALNPVADSGTTLRLSLYNRTGNGYEMFFLDSNGAKTPAGSYALGVTHDSGGEAIIVASIREYKSQSTSDTMVFSDNTVNKGVGRTVEETLAFSDSAKGRFGATNQAKNASTVTNQEKS